MKADPPAPIDGSCAYCGEHHRPAKPGNLHRDIAQDDPFHDSRCCRAWHDVKLLVDLPAGSRGAGIALPGRKVLA